jgi:thymidylate synthase (FAD)
LNVKLIAHTALSDDFMSQFDYEEVRGISRQMRNPYIDDDYNERAAVALTAIRTCYSPLKPTEIVAKEGAKYFGNTASDGEGGSEADRLFRHITRSGHTSTLEHLTYTFAIEGVSRALLAQLTRHRHLSFSVQSQRYVRFGTGDKSGGFDYVTPITITDRELDDKFFADETLAGMYERIMQDAQDAYDLLREAGVPPEDARMVLPNAATCNLVMTGNLSTLLDFYRKRKPGGGAQWEIADLAVKLRDEIVKVDPWVAPYFDAKEA